MLSCIRLHNKCALMKSTLVLPAIEQHLRQEPNSLNQFVKVFFKYKGVGGIKGGIGQPMLEGQ